MAKTKAQRMKEYRARKKEQLGDAWLKRERERVKACYTPSALLTEEENAKRRGQNRKNAKTFYKLHKKTPGNNDGMNIRNTEANSENAHEPQPGCSGDNNVRSTTAGELMTVKMPFQFRESNSNEKKGPKKRQSRALKRSYARIETLVDQNETIKKKLKSAQKRIQRFESTKQKEATTPKSKTDALLKRAGLRPKDVPDIRKQLLYAECVNEEILNTMSENPKEMANLQKVISGKVIKKYRMRSYLENRSMVERRKVVKNSTERKRMIRSKAEKIKGDVENFLNRNYNSRVMPGKGDVVNVGAVRKQKKILNDYLHNLHLKFVSESDYKISKASFCRLRPKEVTLVNFTSRSVCLCARHQNMGFKLKSLKNMNVCSCTSPDGFVEMYKSVPVQFENMIEKITQEHIKFQQWKRVKLPNGKERMRIVEVELQREEYVRVMKKEFEEFVSHVDRVTKQYKSVKLMKENLPKNHVLVQMDISENYNCLTVEEIQSAYWNASMVTLHPTILYFKEDDGNLSHKSMVFVSEVLNHNASMVSAIITKTVEAVKKLVPNLAMIHFWTDSPSSQYRNRSIFDLLSNFESKHGCRATWYYFESGHGKSACDDVGGTAKRNADMAVKQSKAVIQDAHDFFAWAISAQSEIEYQLITPEEYQTCHEEVEKRKTLIKPLKGTMSLHAIATGKEGILYVRNTTCACDLCFSDEGFNGKSNCKWEAVTMKKVATQNKVSRLGTTPINAEPEQDNRGKENEESSELVLEVSDFVVAKYDGICYIGQILEIDPADESYHVNFMAASGKSVTRFKWPSQADQLWLEREDILRTIDPPVGTGKGGRMFTVPEEVISFIEL